MVSLKNLPHEFVFLRKEPNFPVHFQPSPPISSLSLGNSAKPTPRLTVISRTSKPTVPSPYFKRGKTRISRMIRQRVNYTVYFVHHENKQNVVMRRKDWKATYLAQIKGIVKYPYTINRVQLLKSAEETAVKHTSRLMNRYNRCKQNKKSRGNRGK